LEEGGGVKKGEEEEEEGEKGWGMGAVRGGEWGW